MDLPRKPIRRTIIIPVGSQASLGEFPITVLLVDDQLIIGEAVRRMLAGETDITYHFCNDPTQAVARAVELNPTVILQDLVMPQLDGLDLVLQFRTLPATREIPLIVLSTKEDPRVKAEAFARGANDYIVKLPDRIELLARIRHHSRGYVSLLQRNQAYRALLESQQALAAELAEAADYVKSLLPRTLTGPVSAAWQYIPSRQLGGDAFGCNWLGPHDLALYVLDVCGHGVGAALLSVSAMHVLNAQTLPDTDFRRPGQVLENLNATFPMEQHNDMYFTIWYGVLNVPARRLTFACGGHPPAVLIQPSSSGAPAIKRLHPGGLAIGCMPDVKYPEESCETPPGSTLFIYSDGAYEITQPDGQLWTLDQFIELLSRSSQPGVSAVEGILEGVRAVRGGASFDDDFCLLRISL